jgi:hypothetical protein
MAAIVRISEEGMAAFKLMTYSEALEKDPELAAKLKNMEESFACKIGEMREQKAERIAKELAEGTKPISNEFNVQHQDGSAEHFIFSVLDGRVENAYDVAMQLGNMVFNTSNTDLETRAADREAGRELAKHIAENYFDDPKEAQAFMDKINKYIENSELRDKGYTAWFAEMEPIKPEPPSDFDRWLENKGYADAYKMTFSIDDSDPNHIVRRSDFFSSEAVAARAKIRSEYIKDGMAYQEKHPTPYKTWEKAPSWEEAKEMDCDPKYSMYSEQNKAWYAEFLAKSNSVQNIIDNAKLITDFSGNSKWNIVMNLLS